MENYFGHDWDLLLLNNYHDDMHRIRVKDLQIRHPECDMQNNLLYYVLRSEERSYDQLQLLPNQVHLYYGIHYSQLKIPQRND